MAHPSARRYRHWENRLIHIATRHKGLPEELLAWTSEYFGKSPDVQNMLGLSKALKPETETALKVMDRLRLSGVTVRNSQSGK